MARLLLRHGANPKGTIKPTTTSAQDYYCKPAETWAANRWPLTPVQHAFWHSGFKACDRLLEAGLVLDKDTVLWMIRAVLDNGHKEAGADTRAALEFIEARAPDAWRAALRDPLCFTLALMRRWVDLATEFWGHGLELSGFSQKQDLDKLNSTWAAPFHGRAIPFDGPAKLGALCLDAAVTCDSHFLLDGLLKLGVGPIPPIALLTAVEDSANEILELLVKHGGLVHIKDDETGDDREFRIWNARDRVNGCLNPVRLAIQLGYNDSIRVLLKWSQPPVDPWFRSFYLLEACTMLDPETVVCLLEHPDMRPSEPDITGEIDVPLARLVRLADRLCSRYLPDERAFTGPQSILRNIKRWLACVAAFARVGVDAAVRDRAGKSALDYLGEHMAYVGKNRFRRQLAAELRSVGGVEVGDRADPAACYEALAAMEIDCQACKRRTGDSDPE
ncbi:hypothetical protein C8A05DRAFT_30541 [Staphylotrichum tortipilum]|uniref:Uncharacterized protein n=1 Tax=Staphylotrichum tortipilum TaxID=2831512 RepID=A0AAN6RW54_9PEZI|nr:hypothetical protein C8A05DRAFT_30541 [Staphylotrichum longicolle]